MPIKINNKILSIPPYLSTSWSQVKSLHMKDANLAITLTNGEVLVIPDLDQETIQLIFQHHSHYLEDQQTKNPETSLAKFDQVDDHLNQHDEKQSLFKFAYGTPADNIEAVMQHRPDQANSPDLPAEILEKISLISKIIDPNEQSMITPAVENCNCFHCQISRAIQASHLIEEPLEDFKDLEEIKDEDLHFQQWDIKQIASQLFVVTNRLDYNEHYQVFLGEPVGCTCGQTGCEHILAVLKS